MFGFLQGREGQAPARFSAGIDPGKWFGYQVAAWWVGVLALWFLGSLVVAVGMGSGGPLELWWNLFTGALLYTLMILLIGVVPAWVSRIRSRRIGPRAYRIDSMNVERTLDPAGDPTVLRRSNIKPVGDTRPFFHESRWFAIPYATGDWILDAPLRWMGLDAPYVEPAPPTEPPPEPEPAEEPGTRPPDPPESPYSDANQGFSENRF